VDGVIGAEHHPEQVNFQCSELRVWQSNGGVVFVETRVFDRCVTDARLTRVCDSQPPEGLSLSEAADVWATRPAPEH
jgi:hypothetical protein